MTVTPSPQSVVSDRALEQIAFNLCSLHDFPVDFVKANERFARSVITEYLRAAPAPSSLAGGEVWAALEPFAKVADTALCPSDEPDDNDFIRLDETIAITVADIRRAASVFAALSPEAPARDAWIAATDRPDTKGDLWLAVDAAGKLFPGVFVNHRIPAEAALVQRIVLPGQAALTPRHEAPAEGAGDGHMSDCAIHNAPALPVGPCDCGSPFLTPEDIKRAHELRADPDSEDNERFASWYGDTLLEVHQRAIQMDAALRARSSAPEARETLNPAFEAWLNERTLVPNGAWDWPSIVAMLNHHEDALRARSSAPEARETLGNLLAVIHGDGGHRALEVGTKQAALEAEKIVAGLFAAPSADKLREEVTRDQIMGVVRQYAAPAWCSVDRMADALVAIMSPASTPDALKGGAK